MLPLDILRCKLSFFGATRFDPRSDRWVRICMYQDAPFPHEWLAPVRADKNAALDGIAPMSAETGPEHSA